MFSCCSVYRSANFGLFYHKIISCGIVSVPTSSSDIRLLAFWRLGNFVHSSLLQYKWVPVYTQWWIYENKESLPSSIEHQAAVQLNQTGSITLPVKWFSFHRLKPLNECFGLTKSNLTGSIPSRYVLRTVYIYIFVNKC